MKPIAFYLSVFAFMAFMQSCLGARPSDEYDIQYGFSYTSDSDDSDLLYDYMENETFDSFIKKFSADSLFQASRISFPVRHLQQTTSQKIESWIEEKDWWRVIFEDSKDFNLRYFNRRRENNLPLGVVEITDLKNEKTTSYVFELEEGAWFLKEMTVIEK